MSKLAPILIDVQPMRRLVFWFPLIVCIAGCSNQLIPPSERRADVEPATSIDSPSKTEARDQSELNRSEVPPKPVVESSQTIQRRRSSESDSESDESEKASNLGNTETVSAPAEGTSDVPLPSSLSSSNTKDSGTSGGSTSKLKSRPAVEQTLKTVAGLREKSKQASDQKDPGKAFLLLTQAWEATRANANDPQVKLVANELTIEMAKLGKQANQRFETVATDRSKTLTEK